MRAVTLPVGEPGIRYVSSSLQQGLALGRAVASRVDGMAAEAVVPSGVPAERLLEFTRGGLGPSIVGILGQWLRGQFDSGILVVELPLWRPEDRVSGADQFETVVVDQDVYAICSIGEGADKLDATIRSADPAYTYHAMIFRNQASGELSRPSGGLQERLANAVIAVLVGAYDGEGFVLCRPAD